MAKKKPDIHTISILVANKPGVLVRVALVFARRGYNIDSLVVSPGRNTKYSRMTITCSGDPETLEQIIKQCAKLVDVIHAEEHDPATAVEKELALVKVKSTSTNRTVLTKLAKKHDAYILDDDEGFMIVGQAGNTEKLDNYEAALKKYGVVEVVRSGKLLMSKGKEHT